MSCLVDEQLLLLKYTSESPQKRIRAMRSDCGALAISWSVATSKSLRNAGVPCVRVGKRPGQGDGMYLGSYNIDQTRETRREPCAQAILIILAVSVANVWTCMY
jgi:hypothetical protein